MEKTFKDYFNDAVNFALKESQRKVDNVSDLIEKNEKFVSIFKGLILEVIGYYDFLDGKFHTEDMTFGLLSTSSIGAEQNCAKAIDIYLRYDPSTFVQVGNTSIPNFKVDSGFDIDVINSILSEDELGIILFEDFHADKEGNLINTTDTLHVDGRDLFAARDKFMGSIPAMVSDVMKRKREKNK